MIRCKKTSIKSLNISIFTTNQDAFEEDSHTVQFYEVIIMLFSKYKGENCTKH
jgi:hypothetical protein